MIDLRHNKITKEVVEFPRMNLIQMFKDNQFLTNIDLRHNTGVNKQLKFSLSLIMLRNISKLRASGINPTSKKWFNKDVLMVEDTVSAMKKLEVDRVDVRSESEASPMKSDYSLNQIYDIRLKDVQQT